STLRPRGDQLHSSLPSRSVRLQPAAWPREVGRGVLPSAVSGVSLCGPQGACSANLRAFLHYTAQLNSIENLEGEPVGVRRYQSFYQRKKPRVDYCHLAILSGRIDSVLNRSFAPTSPRILSTLHG